MNATRLFTKTATNAAARLKVKPSNASATVANATSKRTVSDTAFRRRSLPSLEDASRLFSESRALQGLGLFAAAMGIGQVVYGRADDVFEHKFTTTKSPQDLADFYGTEDFMEIFCVHPLIVNLMMRGAEFDDDDGTIHSFGLFGPKNLQVSIDFDERESEDDPDTAAWFNKREHFRDNGPFGVKLWEITQHFGYQQLEDGTCEVYHLGRDFSGFFPIRIVFELHSKYVIWATEKYVNNKTFGSDELDDEREEIRHNVPLHVFKEFLHGLTSEVQKAQDKAEVGSAEHKELQVTLQRLKTVAAMDRDDAGAELRTYRSARSPTNRVRLVLDDEETKETIHRAMTQIGAAAGQRHEPVAKMHKLARRATLVSVPMSEEVGVDSHEERD